MIEATVLVVILLLAFLGSLRASVVVAVTLPMAALVTFLMMSLFGMSANLMSLGGLAIAIGLIVDAAVVVVENTVERLNHHVGDRRMPALASGLPGRGRGGHAGGLRHPHHLSRVPAAAVLAGSGGQAVRARRAHDRLRAVAGSLACP